MNRVLIVFHSRSGATAAVARQLAGMLEADLDEVVAIRPLLGRLGFARCLIQSFRRERPDIATARDPADYDLVIIGSPVWAGRLAAPMRTYLTRHADRLPTLAAFCTSGSGSSGELFGEIRSLIGRAPRTSLSLSRDEVMGGQVAGDLAIWARDLNVAARLTVRAA